MKLNYKKVFYVGLAFFLIQAFWQTYDTIIAKILIDKFGLNQTWSGLVMALDNILSLFLLPLFGKLSDKTNTKYGRRTPYIFIGTIIAALTFSLLGIVDNNQTKLIEQSQITEDYKLLQDTYENYETKGEWELVIDYMDEKYQDNTDYQINIKEKMYDILDDYTNDTTIKDTDLTDLTDLYHNYLSLQAKDITNNNKTNLVIFIILLLITLLSMSIFRSPAVALMPDVVIKPLRSKANAVINLMGAFGSILSIILITILNLSKESYLYYFPAFLATSILMIVLLIIFLIKVDENKLRDEYNEEVIKYNIEDKEDEIVTKTNESVKLSLILILLSVFLWYMGYNAVISKLSDYAPKILDMDFTTPLLIAQVFAIISFIPIGILSQKFGRKKMIIIGVIILTISFFGASFLNKNTKFILYPILALTGISWATISVNSFPMVVELSSNNDVGKYTGYYYAFSMAAQIITPIFSGFLMDKFGRTILFKYSSLFVLLSLITMLFVKHGDAKQIKKSALENFDLGD